MHEYMEHVCQAPARSDSGHSKGPIEDCCLPHWGNRPCSKCPFMIAHDVMGGLRVAYFDDICMAALCRTGWTHIALQVLDA